MRVLVSMTALLVMAAASLSAQVWREPHLVTHWVKPLNVPGCPVELGESSISLAAARQLLNIPMKARVPSRFPITANGVQLRVAAGPLPDGMITFRLGLARSGRDYMLLVLPDGDDEWVQPPFERIADDPPPPTLGIKRDTRVFVTVEHVMNESGQIVWESRDSRERLWEALKSSSTQ